MCLVCGRLLRVLVGTDSGVPFYPRGPRWLAGTLEVVVAAETLQSDFRPGSQSKDIQMVPCRSYPGSRLPDMRAQKAGPRRCSQRTREDTRDPRNGKATGTLQYPEPASYRQNTNTRG